MSLEHIFRFQTMLYSAHFSSTHIGSQCIQTTYNMLKTSCFTIASPFQNGLFWAQFYAIYTGLKCIPTIWNMLKNAV